MGQQLDQEYEFVQVVKHKSHLLFNFLDMEALEAEMSTDEAREWGKKIILRIPSMLLSLLNKNQKLTNATIRS